MTKLKMLGRVLLLALVLCIAVTTSYVYFISPTHLRVKTYTYSNKLIDSNLKGMKIAYLSDFNLYDKEDLDYFDKVVAKLNKQTYDLVILGGDLFETNEVFETEKVIEILSTISCDYGKFAVIGDKDLKHKKQIKSIYSQAGIETINNTTRTIYYNNSSFELIACDDQTDISTIEKSSNKLLIDVTHQPDTFKSNAGSIHLQLSGHSLGGSIYLPFIGGINKDSGFNTYNHGKYTKSSSTLIVSNGVKGNHKSPYKLFCSNEITMIKFNTVKKKSK